MLLNLIDIIMLAADKCSLHWSFCHLLLELVIYRRWLLHKQGYLPWVHLHLLPYHWERIWVGVEWKKNCWLTCRHNNVLCGTQMVWTTCCNIHFSLILYNDFICSLYNRWGQKVCCCCLPHAYTLSPSHIHWMQQCLMQPLALTIMQRCLQKN